MREFNLLSLYDILKTHHRLFAGLRWSRQSSLKPADQPEESVTPHTTHTRMRARTHTHTHAHTPHTHTPRTRTLHTHAHTHTHIRTHTHTHTTYTHTHTHTRAHTPTHTHARTHKDIHNINGKKTTENAIKILFKISLLLWNEKMTSILTFIIFIHILQSSNGPIHHFSSLAMKQ